MRVLKPADHRISKWKNGLGETAEIAVHPPGADLSNFEWRVSRATVATGGPFSEFRHVDRLLAILSGDGISLSLGDQAPIRLTPQTAPLAFRGETPAAAELLAGVVVDLNSMARREIGLDPTMQRLDLDGETRIEKTTRFLLIYCTSGRVDGTAVLDAGDTLLLDPNDKSPTILRGTAGLYILTF